MTNFHNEVNSYSKLMLGTVQFGMNYGIANVSGQPSYATVKDILACAYEGGVNCLDTAAAYGTSEAVLGRALAELRIADKVVVATKVRHCTEEFPSRSAADRFVEASVVDSLRALRLETLPVCLLHREEDIRLVESLQKLKDRGLVQHVGVSVMTPEATSAIIAAGLVEAVQFPVNLFDHRFTRHGVCEAARQRGVALFGRSVYLQGLLLMPEEKIPPQLTAIIPLRRRLGALAREAGMSLAELAVRYVLGVEGLTCALVGVDSLEQMQQNLALFAKGPLESTLQRAIEASVPDLPDSILKPNLWFSSPAESQAGDTAAVADRRP